MSPRETANKWMPGFVSSLLVGIILFIIQISNDKTKAIENKIENKADIEYVDKEIINAKKEMDSKRDADYREFKTDLKYIKEGIDELKKIRK